MTQKSPSKHVLLYPIENHRNNCQLTKNSIINFTPVFPIQNNIGIHTEQIQLNHDIGANTPNYTEQTARTTDNGNTVEEIAQNFVRAETSEIYWKSMTERRRQAIIETNIENQQLHSIINDLSKENDKLRIIANHCNHLQNVLQT